MIHIKKLYTRKCLLKIAMDMADKTIGATIKPIPFEEIGQRIKEILEHYTKGRFTTNGESGLKGMPIKVEPSDDLGSPWPKHIREDLEPTDEDDLGSPWRNHILEDLKN